MSIYTAISIIYNPNSTGSSKNDAQELRERLENHYKNLSVQLIATQRPGHAETLAKDLSKKTEHPLIISSSGDGGYHEVINGIMAAKSQGAEPICAVLPAGNANDHSRNVMTQPLVQAVIKEKISKIDLLHIEIRHSNKITTRYAHSYIGLGLTPVAAVELNKQTLNAFRELKIVLRTFFRFRPFKIEVRGTILTLDSILFTNISQMAKVLTVSKEASIKDGEFEVVTFPHARKIALLTKLFRASTTGITPKKSHTEYEFKVLKRMPIQMDGEVSFLPKDSLVRVSSKKQALPTVL